MKNVWNFATRIIDRGIQASSSIPEILEELGIKGYTP
jgi:hypothetical protein